MTTAQPFTKGNLVKLRDGIDAPRMLVEACVRLEYWGAGSITPLYGSWIIHTLWFVRGELRHGVFADGLLALAEDSASLTESDTNPTKAPS